MMDTTTEQVSIEVHGRLCSIAQSLQKILNKRKVSIDQVLKVLLAVKPLDLVLIEMMLEDAETKSVKFDRKKAKSMEDLNREKASKDE